MNRKKLLALIIAVIILIFGSKSHVIDEDIFNSERLDTFEKVLNEPREKVLEKGNKSKKIVVISYNGIIQTDSYFYRFLSNLENIKYDENIAGVILEIDSPGGGVYESEYIKNKILEIKKYRNIPFYVSMGGLAASGGYYIAAPCDKIYASRETMTGSIGVIMSGLNLSGLFEKYGVSYDVIKTGTFKDIGSSYKQMTEEEIQILQTLVDNSYNRFIEVVSTGRNIPVDEVFAIADGRLYDGDQALSLNLIDSIGYYEDALEDMKNQIETQNPQVITYEYLSDEIPSLFSISTTINNLSKSSLEKDVEIIKELTYAHFTRPMYLYGGMQ